MSLKGLNLGICICGSFCTLSSAVVILKELKESGINLYPVISEATVANDTRFGKSSDFYNRVEDICGHRPITTIVEAEPIGPRKELDAMVVMPCTGNTLAKLNNGITDSVVTMACKAHLRNEKPLILAIATNDALGVNLKNIGGLMIRKNIYFVPFGQDDSLKKPTSMIAHYDRIKDTIEAAVEGRQLQPIIL